MHPALAEQGPYVIVLVELPHADGVRIVGNLLGDPQQPLTIGDAGGRRVSSTTTTPTPPHTLLQWVVV